MSSSSFDTRIGTEKRRTILPWNDRIFKDIPIKVSWKNHLVSSFLNNILPNEVPQTSTARVWPTVTYSRSASNVREARSSYSRGCQAGQLKLFPLSPPNQSNIASLGQRLVCCDLVEDGPVVSLTMLIRTKGYALSRQPVWTVRLSAETSTGTSLHTRWARILRDAARRHSSEARHTFR